MATFSTSVGNSNNTNGNIGVSLFGFLSSLFAIELREKLDAKIRGDKSFSVWAWGL